MFFLQNFFRLHVHEQNGLWVTGFWELFIACVVIIGVRFLWDYADRALFSFPDSNSAEECLARQKVTGQDPSTMWLLDIPSHNGKHHRFDRSDSVTNCLFSRL
jgi:hypothetical protein